jgi:voltage-gated potassium channel
MSLRHRVYAILEPATDGQPFHRGFDLWMIALILFSTAGAVLGTVSSIGASYGELLYVLELFTVILFTLELVLRVWTAGVAEDSDGWSGTLSYLASIEGLADFGAVIPFYLSLVFPEQSQIFQALAILRILKLMRYSPAAETMGAVLAAERRTLFAAGTIMLGLLLCSSTLLYLLERGSQPEVFGSIPDAMWWGIATLTTVGYGDVTPITPLGKLFGALVTVLGLGMFALPAGILASGFAQELKQRELMSTWTLVANVPLFESLGAQDIARISRLLEPLVLQSGHVVVKEGDRADAMFFVVAGELDVEIDSHTRQLSKGDFFGEIALLEAGTRSATVRSRTRTQLLALDKQHFDDLLASRPEIAREIHQTASHRRKRDAERLGSNLEIG